MINYNRLFEKSKELATKSGLTQLELYQRFMFERILERISLSKYNNNFILKGGLLLSAMLGIESRSTRDMDISVKGIDVSEEKMTGEEETTDKEKVKKEDSDKETTEKASGEEVSSEAKSTEEKTAEAKTTENITTESKTT